MSTPIPDASRMRKTARERGILLVGFALTALLAFVALYSSFSTIPDSDSYYHLALSRLYGEQGFVEGLEWTRFSVFETRLGDKELLFHAFLVPFVSALPGEVGGRLALAVLCATIATLLARFGLKFGGPGGILVALVAFVGSPFFYARAFRLRPELLALILLLLALDFVARRNRIGLAIVSLAFALSYTAVHVLPGLVIAISAVGWLRSRELDYVSPLASLGGTLAGLLLHPHFPDNLMTFWLQNVSFFRLKGQLDVGSEIGRPSVSGMILLNAGFWLALLALSFLTKKGVEEDPDPYAQRVRDAFLVAAALFFVLFTQMERMITYFVPFALVALLATLRAAGRDLSSIHLGARRVPVAALLLLCSLAGLPRAIDFTQRVSSRPEAEAEWRDLGELIPREARVAAHWGPTGFLVFFAPQGRYLNVLDPLFMYDAHPETWRTQNDLFEGLLPDVPLVAATALDSDFVFALDDESRGGGVASRFEGDPRVRVRRVDDLVLGEIVYDAGDTFVLDWHDEDGRPYPRLPEPARDVEGFVDASRIGAATACVMLEHSFNETGPGTFVVDFSPYGPATLELDGALLLRSSGTGAVLASALRISRRIEPGDHRLRVRTCPDPATGINGYYLLDRANGAAEDRARQHASD
jgi:hypothetical protein